MRKLAGSIKTWSGVDYDIRLEPREGENMIMSSSIAHSKWEER
jgi:hypothetical protein